MSGQPCPDRGADGLRALFAPRSIAMVGASADLTRIRGRLLHLLRTGGFTGPLYPINPSHAEIQGLRAYPSVAELPEVVELAVIAVAEAQVMAVLEDCAARGIPAAAIVSAGANDRAPGERLQDQVAALAQRTGMRILGPNCEGYLDAGAQLLVTFSPTLDHYPPPPPDTLPRRGRVSIVSQSGAMAFALYSRALTALVPVRHVVSTGNEADVELLEVVDYLIGQGESRAILMFVEGLQRPERLAAVAAHARAAGVVLIMAKIGQSDAGQRAAVSHTAHLTGADAAYDAALKRHGILRARTPDELLALACAVSAGIQPQGRRLAIVTASGGAGGWAADICEAAGLQVPAFAPALVAQLAALVPADGATANPVDVTARVVEDGGRTLLTILDTLVDAPDIDAVLVILTLSSAARLTRIEAELAECYARWQRPLIFHSPGQPAPAALEVLARVGGLYLDLPGLACVLTQLEHHQRQPLSTPAPLAAPADLPAIAWPSTPGQLPAADTQALLTAWGIPLAAEALLDAAEAAADAAETLGWPVVVKIVSPDIAHKTEAGGVALGLTNRASVQAAATRILEQVRLHAPEARIDGLQVQRQLPPGRELVVGVVRDPDFGPLVMLGLGGLYVEVLRDTVLALAPLDLAAAHAMIDQLRGRALLNGVRGEPPADRAALAQLLVNVSQLAHHHAGQLQELDLNPVLVYPEGQGLSVVDTLLIASPTPLSHR